MMTIIKKYKYFLLLLFVSISISSYFSFKNFHKKVLVDSANLKSFTPESIKEFDGIDLNKPVYIAYEGYVYDVSPGRDEFYNKDMPYHYLTGRDSTTELTIAGGGIIKNKYKIVGIYIK